MVLGGWNDLTIIFVILLKADLLVLVLVIVIVITAIDLFVEPHMIDDFGLLFLADERRSRLGALWLEFV